MIFISYRRSDSESVVGRIYSELKKHFPTQDVFLDHDSIPLGKPFLDVIRERLTISKFVLVLIGPQWCSITDDKTGQRRLDDPKDFVRLEVETALATPGVEVIPLWVMRAATTTEEIATLPASLQPLFKNNGMLLRPVPDESNDLMRLIGRLSRQVDEVARQSGSSVTGELEELLQKIYASYPGDREKAARSLGCLGLKAANAVPALGKLLKDASGPVRNAAAFALRAIGTDEALAILARYERR